MEDERKKPARQALRMKKKKNCFTTNIMSHAFLCLVIILSHNQVSCWLAILSLSLLSKTRVCHIRKKGTPKSCSLGSWNCLLTGTREYGRLLLQWQCMCLKKQLMVYSAEHWEELFTPR